MLVTIFGIASLRMLLLMTVAEVAVTILVVVAGVWFLVDCHLT